MANLNLGQDVANKRERKYTAAHIVAKYENLYQAAGMRRYGSLSNINPSAHDKFAEKLKAEKQTELSLLHGLLIRFLKLSVNNSS